jgi:hypothetical protein
VAFGFSGDLRDARSPAGPVVELREPGFFASGTATGTFVVCPGVLRGAFAGLAVSASGVVRRGGLAFEAEAGFGEAGGVDFPDSEGVERFLAIYRE